jgi:methyl-accepting chemotaxis protein
VTAVPTGKGFFQRWAIESIAVAGGTVLVIALYVLALLRLPPDQLHGFLFYVVPLAFVGLWIVSSQSMLRLFRPLMTAFDAYHAGTLDEEQGRAAFATACNLPGAIFLLGLVWWFGGGLAVATAMKFAYETFTWFSWTIMAMAAFTGGLVSMIFNFFRLKVQLESARCVLGELAGGPEARGRLVRRISMSRKLLVAVAGMMVVSLCFASLLAQVRASQSVEGIANRLHVGLLEQGVETLAREGSIDRLARDVALGSHLVLLDAAAEDIALGSPDALFPGELRAIRDLGLEQGSSDGFDSPNAFAWRQVPGGVLVAVADRAILAAETSGVLFDLGLFAVIAVFFTMWIARLAAQDVSRVTRPLAEELERVAAGDLTRGRVIESEDELGDLARGVERMTGALHVTVGRVVEAVRGVEATAGSLSAVSEDLAGVTADQVQGLQQVTGSMDRIRGEVGGIAESAHGLSMSVEESSSSILELGVTGEELNQNAVALNERIGEVSSSIEQMMQSTRQVGSGIEELAGASAETSSSMEEMAASMREVDTNAAETARLSEDVVQTADRGRQKVDQTIRGMHAIQEATDAAQSVINGLGARAEEIGQILNVIDDVADETNLLALNAAIIAAQAGEHGRAFSVVADEIKDLADRVLASTKEIGGLIRGVQDEAGNAVGAIESGARSVESGVNLSAEAGVALEEITTSARQSGERISEIVSAVREQSRAAAHVVSLMDQVRDGAERIRHAGTEQSHGNEVVLRNASAMSEVSQQVGSATEEQARGAHRMREAIESVRGAVEQINQSLQEQTSACEQIGSLLERVSKRTVSNEESAGRMREATHGLLQHAEGLRESVRQFRI